MELYAGVISFRWVKQGKAILGWTRFPVTPTIEFNAAQNHRAPALYRSIWSALQVKGIDFTLYGGQMSELTPPVLQ